MTNPVVRVKNLGKRYRIGQWEPYKTLRDTLAQVARAPLRRLSSSSEGRRPSVGNPGVQDYIWALRGVSFEVEEGEVVGIIGPNGAGKTTLLKIISRITRPTEGRIEVQGRVGSLLEVGTGFHPELTGRENTYLNGAILGMKKREIDRKFDEIVSFAEIERFINTPVKRYSSGMSMRLAFAVAAHLEPEILLIDEVLAVGDASFQNKCLNKISDVSGAGRTVLFVSHNLSSVRALCTRTLWLDNGRVEQDGETSEVTDSYLTAMREGQPASFSLSRSTDGPHISSITLLDPVRLEELVGLRTGDGLILRFEVKTPRPLRQIGVEFGIIDIDGTRLYATASDLIYGLNCDIQAGVSKFDCHIPSLMLPAGLYSLDVALRRQREVIYHKPFYGAIEVSEADTFGTGFPLRREWAKVVLDHHWEYVK